MSIKPTTPVPHEISQEKVDSTSFKDNNHVDRAARSRIPLNQPQSQTSPILITLAATSIITGLAVGVLFLVVVSPPGWMIAAVVVSGVAVGILASTITQGKQKILFECSTLFRLGKKLVGKENYNEIMTLAFDGETLKMVEGSKDGSTFTLGAMPNQFSNDANGLEVDVVVSVNESWERFEVGFSRPYSKTAWANLGIKYHEIDALDHKLVDVETLHRAARIILPYVRERKNIYVHCRAGVGRSATVIAILLILSGMRIRESVNHIVSKRKESTVGKKLPALIAFAASLDTLNKAQLEELADFAKDDLKNRPEARDFPPVQLAAYLIKHENQSVTAAMESTALKKDSTKEMLKKLLS